MSNSILKKHKKFTLGVTAAVLLVFMGQHAMAHTRLTVSSTPESSSAHGSTATAVNIPHGCGDNAVIGNVIFLPDTGALMQSSTDSFENFEAVEGTMLDYLTRPATVRLILSKDVFDTTELIMDSQGLNPIGFWAAGGGSIPASNHYGRLPFTISAVGIVETSCAHTVRIVPAIANICVVTGVDGIDGSDSDNVNVDFWTAPGVGTIYDAPAWNYPAQYNIERDLENNPLPASCGDGYAVRIFPGVDQLNRNMPVSIDGTQVWPAP